MTKKLKIAFVSDAIYPYSKGGKEKRLYELSTRLAKQGHDVHIYTMHWWGAEDPSQTKQEDGLTLHALCVLHPLYQQNGDRRSIKEALLFSLAVLKMTREDFDVLDVDHMPYFPVYSAWLATLLKRAKLYGTWHEALTKQDWVSYMGRAGYIAYVIERISIRLPHTIVAASEHTKELLTSEHGRSSNVFTVGSGIDSQLIRSVKPADVVCDVLFVGRLVKDKNAALLIEAVKLLTATHPNIQCVIVGRGIERQNLEKLIAKLSLESNVQIIEHLPEASDVYAYMKAAKVFCLPSNREGFGIAALESLACGTPVVTLNSPANAAKSLINEGVNGSVVEGSAEGVAGGIRYFLQTLKPNNNTRLLSDHDWNKLSEKLADIYQSH